MRRDSRGLEISTGSAAAEAALEDFMRGFLGYRADLAQRLERLEAADPAFVMTPVLRGYATLMAFDRRLLPAAAAAAGRARALAEGATARERLHVGALEDWVAGDLDAALAGWERILAGHPHDIVAVKCVHFLTFWLGRKAEMAASIERVMPAWDAGVAGYGVLLGCRCFAQEEVGNHDAAEPDGRRAVELDPGDLWATHAVAHVMEMQGRREEGIAWLAGLAAHCEGANNLRHHLAWHRALFHLERREFETVLALYDHGFRDLASPLVRVMPDLYIDVQNAAAMLFRLERLGVDVGERWGELADRAEARIGDGLSAFTQPHWMMALAATGRAEAAERLLAGLRAYGLEAGTVPGIVRDVAVPVCEAVRAHRAGAYAVALEWMRPVMARLHELGGSHAQLDVLEQLYLDAGLRAGAQADVAAALRRAGRVRPAPLGQYIGWAVAG